jgi:hypothetical protein
MAKFPLTFLLAVACLAAPTAARALEETYEGWHQFTLQLGKEQTFGFYLEVQPRRRWIERSELEHLILRAAATYRESANWSFMLGPAWTPGLSPSYVNEIRLWEQALFASSMAGGHQLLELRTRFEQRWIENAAGVAYRASQRVKWYHGVGAKVDEPGSWSMATYLELYFNLNTLSDGTVDAGLDQTEFFIGPSFRFSSAVRLETGYVNNYVRRVSSNSEMFNIWYFALNFSY